MNVVSIILDLRSQLAGIEQAIDSANRSDRLGSRAAGARIGRARIISGLRTNRQHLQHAVFSLAELYRLRRRK
jgi:hypothetical protein